MRGLTRMRGRVFLFLVRGSNTEPYRQSNKKVYNNRDITDKTSPWKMRRNHWKRKKGRNENPTGWHLFLSLSLFFHFFFLFCSHGGRTARNKKPQGFFFRGNTFAFPRSLTVINRSLRLLLAKGNRLFV